MPATVRCGTSLDTGGKKRRRQNVWQRGLQAQQALRTHRQWTWTCRMGPRRGHMTGMRGRE